MDLRSDLNGDVRSADEMGRWRVRCARLGLRRLGIVLRRVLRGRSAFVKTEVVGSVKMVGF